MDNWEEETVTLICPNQEQFEIAYNATSISYEMQQRVLRYHNNRFLHTPVPASIIRDLIGWMEHFHFESALLNFSSNDQNIVLGRMTLYDRHYISGSIAKLVKFHLTAIYLKIYRLKFVAEVLLGEMSFYLNHTSFQMLFNSLPIEDKREMLFLRNFI